MSDSVNISEDLEDVIGKVKHSGILIYVNPRCGCIYSKIYGHLFYHENKNKPYEYHRYQQKQNKVMEKLGITDYIKDIEWYDRCIDNYLR